MTKFLTHRKFVENHSIGYSAVREGCIVGSKFYKISCVSLKAFRQFKMHLFTDDKVLLHWKNISNEDGRFPTEPLLSKLSFYRLGYAIEVNFIVIN